jgi:hypothetical protein
MTRLVISEADRIIPERTSAGCRTRAYRAQKAAISGAIGSIGLPAAYRRKRLAVDIGARLVPGPAVTVSEFIAVLCAAEAEPPWTLGAARRRPRDTRFGSSIDQVSWARLRHW